MLTELSIIYKKNAIFYGGATLVITSIVLFAVPYTTMGLEEDSFGIIYNFLKPCSVGLQQSFIELNNSLYSENCPQQISFCSFFRPIESFFFYGYAHLFGFWAYPYRLLLAFWHGITAVCIYWIFSFLMNYWLSFLLALVFMTSPVFGQSFLRDTCNAYPVYLFFEVALILYVKFLTTNKSFYYYLAAGAYLLALFSYEHPFVFPLILVAYFFLFDFFHIIKNTWIFLIVNVVYVLIRFWLLAAGSCKNNTVLIPHFNIKQGILNFLWCIKPFFGFTALSNNVVLFFLTLSAVALVVFISCAKARRRLIFFYMVAFFIASWPVFIAGANCRYMCWGLPFLLLILFEMLVYGSRFFKGTSKNYMITGVLLVLIGWGSLYNTMRMKLYNDFVNQKDSAFNQLTMWYEKQNPRPRAVVFVGVMVWCNDMGFPLGSSLEAMTRFYFNDHTIQTVSVARYYCKSKPKKNSFFITNISGGYRLSFNQNKCGFLMDQEAGEEIKSLISTIRINAKYNHRIANDISITFDERWLTKNRVKDTIFVVWDPVNTIFNILDTQHLIL